MIRSRAEQIKRRTLFGGALAALLALLLWLADRSEDGAVVFYVGGLLAILCAIEAGRMGHFARRGFTPALIAGALSVLFLSHPSRVGAEMDGEQPFLSRLSVQWGLAVGTAVIVCALVRGLTGRRGWVPLAICAALSSWLLAPLPWLHRVWADFGQAGLVALLVLSKIGDIAAYYVGNAIGRSHPFPKLSPGKTTEGCVASLLATLAVGAAFAGGELLPPMRLGTLGGCLAGGLVNLAAQAGDLLESWIKRRAGVKDSSAWLGPSGGLLDVVDSLLLAVPAALLAWPKLFAA